MRRPPPRRLYSVAQTRNLKIKNQKLTKIHQKYRCAFGNGKIDIKIGKNWIWADLGLDLGVWSAVGHLLGALGRLWGSFGAFKIEFFSNRAQDGIQEAFWTNLGWIWGGLGGALLLCILSLARIVCPLLEFILL